MKIRFYFLSILFVILYGCTSQNNEMSTSLNSNIQYIGSDSNFVNYITDNTSIKIVETNKALLNKDNFKYIFIENDEFINVSIEEIENALKNDYRIYVLNVDDTKAISKVLFNSDNYEWITSSEKSIVNIQYDEDDNLYLTNFVIPKDEYNYKNILARIIDNQ